MGVMGMNRLLVAAVALTALVAACSHGPSPTGPVAGSVACPDDVEVFVLAQHSCGMVDRSDGSQVFFLRVEPPQAPVGDPVLETGNDLGTAPGYGGLVPIAQRTGRELIIVDLPGVGHSLPLLACPAVDGLSAAMATDPAATRPLLVDAIGACHARTGVTLDFGSTAAALHDVVDALGLDRVVAMSHGTTGLASLEWAATHPEDLDALVLDTPLVTVADPISRVDQLISDVAAACQDQPDCRGAHPDLEQHWHQALATLAAEPLRVNVSGSLVPIDAEQLRRAVLWVAGGSQRPQALPDLIEDASSRTTNGVLGNYAKAVVQGPPLCVGYLPSCAGTPRVAVGALLSLYCPGLLDDPTWREPCHAWGAAEQPLPHGVSTPTLVLTGRYDPFARPEDTRRALGSVVPGAFYVEDPAGSHNVLGGDCMREVRNAWLAGDVTAPPSPPTCLQGRVIPFAPSTSSP